MYATVNKCTCDFLHVETRSPGVKIISTKPGHYDVRTHV